MDARNIIRDFQQGPYLDERHLLISDAWMAKLLAGNLKLSPRAKRKLRSLRRQKRVKRMKAGQSTLELVIVLAFLAVLVLVVFALVCKVSPPDPNAEYAYHTEIVTTVDPGSGRVVVVPVTVPIRIDKIKEKLRRELEADKQPR